MIVQHYLLFGLLVVFALSASHGSNTQLAVYIEEGDDIVLNCTFPGARSVKEVKWKFYKNETETIVLYQTKRRNDYKQRGNFHGNLNLGDGAMLLSAVQQTDIGRYVGRILSKRQDYFCEVNLTFYTKFPQTQKILTVDEGENVVLPCKWPGKPQKLNKTEWTIKSIGDNTTLLKNMKIPSQEDDNVSERFGNFIGDNRGDCSVLLSEVKPSDAGCYIGKLYNKSHIYICEVTLQIVSINITMTSSKQPKIMVVDESKDVVLNCKWPGKNGNVQNVEWTFKSNGRDSTVLYKDAKPKRHDLHHHHKHSVRHHKYHFEGNLKSGDGSMLLTRVQQSDVGQYTGKLVTSKENCTCKINLYIGTKERKDSFSMKEGDSPYFECKWPNGSEPITSVQWKFQSIETERIVLTCPATHNDSSDQRAICVGDLSNGDGSMLLDAVNESDVGFYTGMLFGSGRVHVCEFDLHISEGELHSAESFEFEGFGVDIRSS